jgi:hypothetical protein
VSDKEEEEEEEEDVPRLSKFISFHQEEKKHENHRIGITTEWCARRRLQTTY